MSKIKINNYTFDKTAKTVTFTDYTTIRLDGVLLIINVTSNSIIYNFADPTKGGTVLNNIITLAFDTSTMNNADNLLIYYDDASVIQKVIEQSPLNISGLANITNQLDDATADKQDLLYKLLEEILNSLVTTEDNIPLTDLLLSLTDNNPNNRKLQVQLSKDLKQEPDGGLYVADMKGPYIWNSSTAAQPFYLDCTGFQSILIHKLTTGIVTPYMSNNMGTFTPILAVQDSTAIANSTLLTTAGMYGIPVTGKYLQLIGPASVVQCIIYLSQTPLVIDSALNIAGANAITAGVTGTLAVGGNVAAGVAPTINPLLIGGADQLTTALTRRLLTDVLGRLSIGNVPSQNSKALNTLGYDPQFRNILEVQDTTKVEDNQGLADLLFQILNELKILNNQIFIMQSGQISIDNPDDLRQNITLFN